MDPSTEIRKLGPKDVNMLSSILDNNEQWRSLMSIIPEFLERNNYKCDISDINPPKYDSEHFRILENLKKLGRKCTEVLISEWGCSGRIRPTIGHLLYLLVKAKLFRAADYVAVDLLHQERPERPCNGPEAKISPILLQKDTSSHDQKNSIDNSHTTQNLNQRVPAIIITDVNQEGMATKVSAADMIEFSVSSIHENIETDFPVGVNHSNSSCESNTSNDQEVISRYSVPEAVEKSVSDMIHFSSLIPVGVEEITVARSVENTVSSANFSNSSASNESSNTQNFNDTNYSDSESRGSNSDTSNIPDFTGLNYNSGTGVECEPLNSLEENVVFPALSTMLHNECTLEDSYVLPDISKLHRNNNSESVTLDISPQVSSDNPLRSASCGSPLPALSLDTRLPHFNYSSLLTATNNFDSRPFSGPNDGGRLLGSGEFGSVFLALRLLDKPVAVKKIFLKNGDAISVDDEVTKQFRNEVEVLSKYKHENLLNLLGFSCDGCTYCLLYEYIPGGPLKNRLQAAENILNWKSRLSISIGLSKAISYLHAAFPTPLIHRDINSSNILLVSDNNPKLADFGLIKLIPNQNNAVATTVYGTSAYMAREAFAGDISVKLDTFSFGVVLLELITSLPPLDDNRMGNDLVTHIEEIIDDDNILPLVDNRAGNWEEGNVNYAVELFNVAQSCLKVKRRRPTMVEVKMTLDELTKNLNFL